MLKLIIKLGKYLEARFPEKVVVTQADYTALLTRVTKVEKEAVHVDAVKELVKAVKLLKDDHDSFKASMGFTPLSSTGSDKEREIRAVLNGEAI